jgi:hypothetical protein
MEVAHALQALLGGVHGDAGPMSVPAIAALRADLHEERATAVMELAKFAAACHVENMQLRGMVARLERVRARNHTAGFARYVCACQAPSTAILVSIHP